MTDNASDIVQDVGKWEWSEMWKTEDWWAIWLGFAILIIGMIAYFPQTGEIKQKLSAIEAKYEANATKTKEFKTIA